MSNNNQAQEIYISICENLWRKMYQRCHSERMKCNVESRVD